MAVDEARDKANAGLRPGMWLDLGLGLELERDSVLGLGSKGSPVAKARAGAMVRTWAQPGLGQELGPGWGWV